MAFHGKWKLSVPHLNASYVGKKTVTAAVVSLRSVTKISEVNYFNPKNIAIEPPG